MTVSIAFYWQFGCILNTMHSATEAVNVTVTGNSKERQFGNRNSGITRIQEPDSRTLRRHSGSASKQFGNRMVTTQAWQDAFRLCVDLSFALRPRLCSVHA